jgi:hypothetical protein
MRQTLTISSPRVLKKEITDYIYFMKLKKLRNKMIVKAQKNGIFTDQDVFYKVS